VGRWRIQDFVSFLRISGIQYVGWTFGFKWTGWRSTVIWNEKKVGFKPTWIVIHHSWTKDGSVKDWDAIKRYHIETNGWNDIGYQIGIEKVGDKYEVLPGREIGEVGAHAKGFNAKSIGICLVGNFDSAPPSDEQLYLLASVCRELQRKYKIFRDQVIGHRETYILLNEPVQKSCPGKMFDLDKFRARLLDVNEL